MTNIINTTLTILFLLMLVALVLFLGIIFIKVLIFMIKVVLSKQPKINKQILVKEAYWGGLMILMLFIVVLLSQQTAGTPDIDGENAISELKRVEFNGRTQWISIRGQDKNAPVLLFLAGGPGGSQLAAVRFELEELEKHFVVVGWDQPGSGKSYSSGKSLKPEHYVEDGLALTDYLLESFEQDKIFIMGESWGSYLGIQLADHSPNKYHGVINTGQMVNFLETELLDYSKGIELTFRNGDFDKMNKLIANGKPPYFGDDVTMKIAAYISYLSVTMDQNPEIHNPGYETIRDIMAPEYGILDKINFFRGILYTFNDVYQQLYEHDLCESTPELEVPILMLIGRHDLNAPPVLAETYFEMLKAPLKEWVWFEHSGHNPWINETDAFVKEVLSFKALVE